MHVIAELSVSVSVVCCCCSWAFWMFRNGLIYLSYFIFWWGTLHALWELFLSHVHIRRCWFHAFACSALRTARFVGCSVASSPNSFNLSGPAIVDIGPNRIESAHVSKISSACIRISSTITATALVFYFMWTEKTLLLVYLPKNPIIWNECVTLKVSSLCQAI